VWDFWGFHGGYYEGHYFVGTLRCVLWYKFTNVLKKKMCYHYLQSR
jgi:hypothetical protein